MANVRNGGRKKKLKVTMPTMEATMAGREPHAVATNRMIKRKARATVVGLMCSPKSFNNPLTAAIPMSAAAYPNQDLLSTAFILRSESVLVRRSSVQGY